MNQHTPGTDASPAAPVPDPPSAPDMEGNGGILGDPRPHRPVHLHPGFVLVVIAGGMGGALARYGLSTALPAPGGWPVPTLVINLSGAFLLGLLLEALGRRGPDAGRLRLLRILAGTGFLGAFTTYSSLALETNILVDAGRAADAVGYLAATVLGGALATTAGILSAAAHHQRINGGGKAARQSKPAGGNR